MSDKLATYSFLPWIRQGIANQISSDDLDAAVRLRASVDVSLQIEGSGGDGGPVSGGVSKAVGLYGPGDVVGIEASNVIRTEPRDGIANFEPNYLAAIEFYDEDLPWRYTPARPGAQSRLRPWFSLVVLKEGEFTDGRNLADRPLAYIEVENADQVLPPADQLWAWAHVHVNRDLVQSDIQTASVSGAPYIENVSSEATEEVLTEFENTLAENPDQAYSRVVCPRHLEENTAYHAFLVPTFESGRLAGLGQDVEAVFDAVASLHATSSAWEAYADRYEPTYFPVYYRWRFHTSAVGDFEYLVRLLEPRLLDSRVGRRDMDVQDPGLNLSGITDVQENGESPPQLGGVLRLGGALRIPRETMSGEDREEADMYDEWMRPYPRKFQSGLAAFINLADDYAAKSSKDAHRNRDLPVELQNEGAWDDNPDPVITPPLYGRWHAMTSRLLEQGDAIPDDNWLHELNLDPRFRVAAGFGTGVVQKNQESYMEAAWQQVGDVLAANKKIRQAQLARSAGRYWYKGTIRSTKDKSAGAFLWLTQPVHARVLSTGVALGGNETKFTVHHWVRTSKVPATVLSPSIRRIARPGGRLSRRLNLDPKVRPAAALIDRINDDEIRPAPPKTAPKEVPSPESVSEQLQPSDSDAPQVLLDWAANHPWLQYLFVAIALLLLVVIASFVLPGFGGLSFGLQLLAVLGIVAALVSFWLFRQLRQLARQIEQAELLHPDNQTPEAVDELPKMPDFVLTLPGQGIRFREGDGDSAEAGRFKDALRDVGALLQVSRSIAEQPEKARLDIPAVTTAVMGAIDPDITVPRATLATVFIPTWIREQLSEEFVEAMAYPEIDIPMYRPLLKISTELFLPNINLIAENSISLLETNQRFIEAYLAGLNHEFARELLWREYPTDQRGSYFRQFWDASGYLSDAGDPEVLKESLRDIPPLHEWSRYSKLGDHDHRETEGESEEEVVLVVRGELLKRYPNAVIYAHRAQWQAKEGTTDVADREQERIMVPLTEEQESNPPRDFLKTPLYEAKADPDIYFFGFDLTVVEARGLLEGEPSDLDDGAGWFFVINERPGEPRFGLDIGETEIGEIEVWNDLAWENVTPAVTPGGFLQITEETATIDVGLNSLDPDDTEKEAQREEDVQLTWNKDMNAAELAYILFQSPVLVAVHAAEMLPKP